MRTSGVYDQLQNLCGIEVAIETVSKATDKILPVVWKWQIGPLNPIYLFVLMDGIRYKSSRG